ncbi:DUF3888 domain-containing protein [Brevibacillus laterosporus]|nr:DUF3888 domain-containing protein [Brevibacillus laterosporus]TPG70886.1 DUF3888 domain-containing protein [Brevibacillus laterosporus]TPG91677.1 DUF3888 domain-containing protein [Brevibacillus laterosporus]
MKQWKNRWGHMAVIAFAVLLFTVSTSSESSWAQPPSPIPSEPIQGALILTMNPHVIKAITHYYGYPRAYDLSSVRVVGVSRSMNQPHSYEAVFQVRTYEGNHAPPFSIETIKLAVHPDGVQLTGYSHQGDEWEAKRKVEEQQVQKEFEDYFHIQLAGYQQMSYYQIAHRYRDDPDNALLLFNQELISQKEAIQKQSYLLPMTFLGKRDGYILYKRSDGSQIVYFLLKELGSWKLSKMKHVPSKGIS